MKNKTRVKRVDETHNRQPQNIKADESDDMPFGQQVATMNLAGLINAPVLLASLEQINGLKPEVHDWMRALQNTKEQVKDGETKRIEGMLIGQMYALDSLFTNLIMRALKSDLMPQFEAFTRLALKAQNQSRATAQTLASIKNPHHTVFAGQANISSGPQQVNNTVTKGAASEMRDHHDFQKNSESEQNELLNVHEEINRMDARAAGEASRSDQSLEAMGSVNRSNNRGRQSKHLTKRI
jgi:hypothetical protein